VIVDGHLPAHIDTVRALFKEYARALDVDLLELDLAHERL
jgi:hypothetical protein